MSSKPVALAVACNIALPYEVQRSLRDPDFIKKVMAFHDFYKVPMLPFDSTDNSFNHMTNDRVALRAGFQVEELIEFFAKGLGLKVELLIEDAEGRTRILDGVDRKADTQAIIDSLNVGEAYGSVRNGKEVADAAADSTYFWIGFLLEMGYDLRPVFEEVHASNMTKPDENGEPIYSEDGKVMKGPNFVEPNIAAVLGMED